MNTMKAWYGYHAFLRYEAVQKGRQRNKTSFIILLIKSSKKDYEK